MDDTTNSYAILIRDGMIARMRTFPVFAAVVKFARTKMKPVQRMKLPYLGVYFIDENLGSDGDANAAEPRFLHTCRLGISYMVMNNDPEAAEDELDAGHWAIMNMLKQQHWHSFDNGVEIEAITRITRRHMFGNVGLTNETAMAEMQMEISFTFRTMWEPTVEDDLKTVHVTTRYPDTDPGRSPVITEYDLTSEE